MGVDLFTDANGFYSFTDLPRTLTYFVIPDPFTPYDFVPSQKMIVNLTGSEVVDFVGTRPPTKVIAGRVVEAVSRSGHQRGSCRPGARQRRHRYGVCLF